MNSYMVSNSGVMSVFHNGKYSVVDKSHINYNKILDKLKEEDFDNLNSLIDVKNVITKAMNGKVEIKNGQVFYSGQLLHNYLTETILSFVEQDFDVSRLLKFLENLMLNPSKKSLDNLFRFLEINKHPITEDGCFLAYKRVNDNYMDMHQGKYNNSPGKVVSMPRNEVEDDPEVTCAAGLHVANYDYAANQYGSGKGRLVVCKVNPKDVVSVPTDYNSSKMRVCEYLVLQDYEKQLNQNDLSNAEDDWDDFDDEDYDDEDDFDVDDYDDDDWDDE